MTSLLEDRGIKVLLIGLPERVSGLTSQVRRQRQKKKVPVIVVNRETTLERRRFTLAHELAHRLIDESSPVNHEKASDVFAGAFLVPRDHLVREIGKARKAIGCQELIQLKLMYRVGVRVAMERKPGVFGGHAVSVRDSSSVVDASHASPGRARR